MAEQLGLLCARMHKSSRPGVAERTRTEIKLIRPLQTRYVVDGKQIFSLTALYNVSPVFAEHD